MAAIDWCNSAISVGLFLLLSQIWNLLEAESGFLKFKLAIVMGLALYNYAVQTNSKHDIYVAG